MYNSFNVIGYLHDDINQKEVLNKDTTIKVECKGIRHSEYIIIPIRVCNNLFLLNAIISMKKGDRLVVSGRIALNRKKNLELYAEKVLNCELEGKRMR